MFDSDKVIEGNPKIIQWLLDTRPLWPVPKKSSSREEVAELKIVAAKALSFLSATEQASVLRYYHLKDAKMSLVSHLLKHLIITRYCGVPWSKSSVSRDTNGKPCFIPPSSSQEPCHVDFNVSHQAGIVSLIAVVGAKGVTVGTDVVCVNERIRQDHRHIEKDGFFDWVDIHADVFAESEVNFMKLGPMDLDLGPGTELKGYGKDTISRCQWRNRTLEIRVGEGEDQTNVEVESNRVIDAKLRRFYAMWCLRETYVKMTGEALLAPWLKELEISFVRMPIPSPGFNEESSLKEGSMVEDFRIHFKGKLVTNVKMELTALGRDFMVGGAARLQTSVDKSDLTMGRWVELDLETDVLAFGEQFPQHE